MKDFQERVLKEKDELQEKYEKLSKFIGSDKFHVLDNENQDLLLAQQGAMQSYLVILMMRINKFDLTD